MTTASTSRAPAEGVIAALGSFVLLVVSVAVVGGMLAAGLGSEPHDHPAGATGPYRVAEDVPVSFGFIAVEHSATLKGLTPKQLGGAVHGIGTFVSRKNALVQASITISNTSTQPQAYSPRQFRLVATAADGTTSRIELAHATVRAGELQPDAAVDARLSFIAPRDGSRLALEFRDPGARAPVTILLGNGSGRLTEADRRAIAQGHRGAADDGHDHDH
jgi:Domain of unknown function (DUF4352)